MCRAHLVHSLVHWWAIGWMQLQGDRYISGRPCFQLFGELLDQWPDTIITYLVVFFSKRLSGCSSRWDRVSLTSLGSPSGLGWLSSEPHGSASPCLLGAGITCGATMPIISCGSWEIRLSFSCLQGQHFTNRAFSSPALLRDWKHNLQIFPHSALYLLVLLLCLLMHRKKCHPWWRPGPFSFSACTFGLTSKNSLPTLTAQSFPSVFSLQFSHLVHFELTFVYRVR